MPISIFLSRWSGDAPPSEDSDLFSHILLTVVVAVITTAIGRAMLRPVIAGLKKVLTGESAAWARRFWRSLGGLLFGEPRPTVDALADERVLLARIRELGGVVTTADLMGLFGWSPEKADSEVMRVMLDYGGDVTVAENGAILWVFPAFSNPSPKPAAGRTYRFDAPDMPRFFGCTRGFIVIAALLFVPGILGPVIHPYLKALPSFSEMWTWSGPPSDDYIGDDGLQAFGIWPGLLVVLGILGRIPAHIARRRADADWHRQLGWIEAACNHPEGTWADVTAADSAIIANLGGDIDMDRGTEGSRVFVVFPAVKAAKDAADSMRRSGEMAPTF